MDMVEEFVGKKVYTTEDEMGKEIPRSTENDRKYPEMNLRLFEDGNLEISKWDKFSEHRGKYPTIYLNLRSITGHTYLEILVAFREAIRNAFRYHWYLLRCEDLWSTGIFDKKEFQDYLNPPKVEYMTAISGEEKVGLLSGYIKEALVFLAKLLHKHFGHEIFLLIDEYDAPINNTIFKSKELCKEVNGLLSNFFGNLLKDERNSFIGRALITGISYFSSVGLSDVNTVQKHMFLRGTLGGDDKYEEFYGITEDELKKLRTKFVDTFWGGEHKLTMEKLNSYYNGFKSIGDKGVKIYPIWSIVHALTKGKLGNYWEQSGIMAGATDGFKIPIVRIAIKKLLAGTPIKCEIPYQLKLEHLQDLSDLIMKPEENMTLLRPDVFLSFLMQQGYLTYGKKCEEDEEDEEDKEDEEDTEIFEVKIPNKVLEKEFNRLMTTHVGDDYDKLIANVTAVFDEFPDKLSDDIVMKLISCIQKAFEYVSDKWHNPNEDAYHCVIFHCLCKSSKYISCTELAGKKGRLDIAFMLDNKRGVIIEVKRCNDSKTALKQIISKDYRNILRKSLSKGDLPCVCKGLNVDEKNKVSISYMNEDEVVHHVRSDV